mgnify:CR=1 FL=1
MTHCKVEDCLFVPAVTELEQSTAAMNRKSSEETAGDGNIRQYFTHYFCGCTSDKSIRLWMMAYIASPADERAEQSALRLGISCQQSDQLKEPDAYSQ